MPNSDQNDLLFTSQAASVIGVDVRTIHRWVDSGKLPTAVPPTLVNQNNAPYLFRRADVERLRDERRAEFLAKAGVA